MENPITPGQQKQIERLIEDASHNAAKQVVQLDLTCEQAQRVIKSGNLVAQAMIEAALKMATEVVKPSFEFKFTKLEEGQKIPQAAGLGILFFCKGEIIGYILPDTEWIDRKEKAWPKRKPEQVGRAYLSWLSAHGDQIPVEWQKYDLVAPAAECESLFQRKYTSWMFWATNGWYHCLNWYDFTGVKEKAEKFVW